MKKTRPLAVLLATVMILSTLTMSMTAQAALPFNDTDGHWATDAIEFVVENGLMNGVGNGENFAPNMSLTRGMVVTVLYRDNGSPDQPFKNIFLDVKEGQYYTAAAEWAYENGIVNGTGFDDWGEPYFSPDRDITRQELATMFARYADFKYVDTAKGGADISAFPDAATVATWATDAVKWSVGVGLITGKAAGNRTTLSPSDKAVRAEFATIIKRFIEKDEDREFTYRLVYSDPVYKNKFSEHKYAGVESADIYVAVDGNDNNPGTKDKPLATFEAAKAKVRSIKKDGERVVAFMAGNYGNLSVSLNAEDAGTEKSPIKYCAYGDGDVIFNNGILIEESELQPISDSEREFFGDKVNVSLIKKADLTGKIDKFTSRTTVFSGSSTLHEARFPNMKPDGTDAYYSNFTTTVDPYSSIKLLGPLKEVVDGFKTTKGMKISGYLRTGWLVDTFPVKSWDSDNSIITFDFENCTFDNGYKLDQFELMYEGRTTDLVFFHNLADQLDIKGEYWFNEETKQLYIYDAKGDYAISAGPSFININYCDYVSLAGFDFSCSSGNVVSVMVSHHVNISDCTISYISGNQCIYSWGSDYNIYEYNEVFNFICGGIMSNEGGDLNTLEESHNVIRNNYVHDFGHPSYFSSSGGIILWNSVGSVAEHNILENGVHGGITFSGVDNYIRYNVLDNMVSNTKDYGAVYGGGKAHRGNKICYNLIMNMDTNKEAYGIYIDECGAGQEVFGNIFHNAGAHAVTLNGGRENDIHDNVTINTDAGDLLMSNPGMYDLIVLGTLDEETIKAHQTYAHLISERAAEGTSGYDAWKKRFPEVYNFNIDPTKIGDSDCLFTTVNFVKNNTVIGSTLEFGETYEKFAVKENNKAYTLENGNFFNDPTHGDYTFKKGMELIDFDFSKLGVQ